MSKCLAPTRTKLAVIILAAGGSSRLGRPKQLLRYRGQPLIVRAVHLAATVTDDKIIVVLGDQQLRLRRALRSRPGNSRLVTNSKWRLGQASSLRRGLAAVPAGTAAVLVLVVDQVFLTAKDLTRLVSAWRRRAAKPAVASHNIAIGVPAIIPRRWFASLRKLEGDVGAKPLLRTIACLTQVAMPHAAFDVDTEQDAAKLEN